MRTATWFALLATMLAAVPVQAQESSVSTWVSASGSDSNVATACQFSAPCQTLTAALSVTFGGGTISCIDPTPTAGPLTISIDITIDCSGGIVFIFTQVSDGRNAININTGGINVTLRGLVINGDGITGIKPPIGIDVTGAAIVRLENCKISGFGTAGIKVEPSSGNAVVKIQDSPITQNGSGILITPTGSATASISILRSQIENNNGGGIHTDSSNGAINVDIADSAISNNASNGFNVASGAGGHNNMVSIARTTIANNGLVGIQSGGSTSAVLLDTTLLDSNTSGATDVLTGARILSYGNNRIVGAPGSGFTGPASLQ